MFGISGCMGYLHPLRYVLSKLGLVGTWNTSHMRLPSPQFLAQTWTQYKFKLNVISPMPGWVETSCASTFLAQYCTFTCRSVFRYGCKSGIRHANRSIFRFTCRSYFQTDLPANQGSDIPAIQTIAEARHHILNISAGQTSENYKHAGHISNILWVGAMLLRPWSLRPRLFKTSLGHYVPWFITSLDHNVPLIWSLRPLYVMSPVWNVPGCLRFLYITSLDHYAPWSQRPLNTTSLWSLYPWSIWLFVHLF